MEKSHFFAHVSRMKLIQRWPLMRSISNENVSEHSLQVAFVAHALAIIKNKKFGGRLNPERIALMAMYHDASEVLTGDLPTPIKYHNIQMATEYKKIETAAELKLIDMLPEEFRQDFAPFIHGGHEPMDGADVVKQADTICAYLKCLEEISLGNNEYALAKKRLDQALQERWSDEMGYFLEVFAPSFSLSLDEIS